MQSIKRFFEKIRRAVTDLSFYREVYAERTSTWVGYLYWMAYLLALIGVTLFAVKLLVATPVLSTWLSEAQRQAPALYPQPLVLTFKGGILSDNVREPLFIELPAVWKGTQASDAPQHFIALDTKKGSVETYATYNTMFLVTKTGIVYPDRSQGPLRFQPFSDVKDTTVTRKTVDDLAAKASPLIGMAPTIIAVLALLLVLFLPFFLAAAFGAWYVLYLLFATLLLFVLSRILGRKDRYGELYKLSVYGITPAILCTFVTAQLGIAVPFLFTLIYLVWMGFVLGKLPQRTQKA